VIAATEEFLVYFEVGLADVFERRLIVRRVIGGVRQEDALKSERVGSCSRRRIIRPLP